MSLSLRLFLRILGRNREVYLLKILTLSIAFASATLVILFSLNEFTFDRFHDQAHSIFRIIERNEGEAHLGNRLSVRIPSAVYKTLEAHSKDSVIASRVKIMKGLTVVGDKHSSNDFKIHSADKTITDIFTFDIIHGSIKKFLDAEHSVIISSSTAERFFGTTHASGKEISIYSDDTIRFDVSAVYRDFPSNSHEDFEVLIPFDDAIIKSLGFDEAGAGVYGRVNKCSLADVEEKLRVKAKDTKLVYKVQALPEVYFGPRISGEDSRHGDRYSVLILICITALILFLTITSYVNLTTLTLPGRSKELAVKKLAGTSQIRLFLTFCRESVILVFASFALGILALLLTSDLIEPVLGISVISLIRGGDLFLFSVMVCIFFLLVISPLFLTFKFIKASPSRLLGTATISFPRLKRIITILQLGISIFLIVSSMVIKRQINYSLLKEPGRNYEQVVYVGYPDGLTDEGLIAIRSGWKKYHPNIVDVIAMSQLPDRISSKEINSPFYLLSVDPFFLEFFNLNMRTGNWFKANAGDSIFVLNQKGAECIGGGAEKNLVGVIDDMSSQFNQAQKPVKFKLATHTNSNYLCIRILEVDIRRTIRYLSGFFDNVPVSFLNRRFEQWLKYQDSLNNLSSLLAIISAVLSCCAIYGLSVSLVRDKLKQIAVHKMLGANTFNVTLFLAREFIKSTVISIVVFGPATYIFITEFLRNFVYSTDFEWQDPVFPLAYCVITITLLCCFQALSLSRKDLSSALKG